MEPFKIATPRPSAPITVVIPVFNAERFVGRALKMLAFQTVLPSKIIIVDDGSTDNTAAIAENTSARVIRARHSGLAATRNVGIAAASNEWIALLDVDDLWDPRKLEYQWNCADRIPM
jgi:glycosyltransferase involved in cell wall biosynthesis